MCYIQVTHIGKEVNSLRKWNGEVGEKAKALVRKWKRLLPDSENGSSSSSSGAAPVVNGSGEDTTSHSHNQASHRKQKGGRLEEGGSTSAHVHIAHTSRKSSAIDGLAGSSDCDDFSKALMMDITTTTASSSSRRTREPIDTTGSLERGHSIGDTHRHRHKHKHKYSHKEALSSKISSAGLSGGHKPPSVPVSTPQKPVGVTPTISNLTRPKSPPVGSFLDTPSLPGGGPTYSPRNEDTSQAVVNSRKRKGIIIENKSTHLLLDT